jgi:hypothetical protein
VPQNAALMKISGNLVLIPSRCNTGIVLQTDGNLHYDTRNNEDGVNRTLGTIGNYRGQKMSILESEGYLPISPVLKLLLMRTVIKSYCYE